MGRPMPTYQTSAIYQSSAWLRYIINVNMTMTNRNPFNNTDTQRGGTESTSANGNGNDRTGGYCAGGPSSTQRINVQTSPRPDHRRQRRRVVTSICVSVLAVCLVVAGALLLGHYNLVATCQDNLDLYNQQADKLQSLLDDSADYLDITTDDVLESDKSIVNDFQTSYKQAQEELAEYRPADDQCTSRQSNEDLLAAIADLSDSLARVMSLSQTVDSGSEAVADANHVKELYDAKSALSSTLLSAQALSQNQSLSSSTRTQLNRAVSLATGILESNDLDDIKSARNQLDDIIDEVNDSITAANSELLNIEQKVSAIATQPDANGSYTDSAIQILHAAGLQEVWGLENMRGACSISSEQASSWLAAFCAVTPNFVYINTSLGPDATNDAYFADAMRHEIAHYLIYRRCGTSAPTSIGDQANAESTASSYAVLYLGANANTLNRAGDSRYHMNRASDEAAARIHAGQCY